MTESKSKPSRRALFKGVVGAGVALPKIAQELGVNISMIGEAQAQFLGGSMGDQDVVYIPAAKAQTLPMAEWKDTKAATGANRIAGTAASLERAPKDPSTSHYEAKLYNYPTGSLRVLTWKKGTPVVHQVTFETEIYVIQGSLTLTPLPGHPGKPTKINTGDCLFMPAGVLTNAKPSEDTILLQAFVASAAAKPKAKIVTAKEAQETLNLNWQEGDKEFTANKPDEIKKAPKTASRFTTKRYVFDGNSVRVANLKKGGRTNFVTNNRVDVLMYIAKGKIRRKEGNEIFELSAGDTIREKKGNGGWWELIEDATFIATDAPLDPKGFAPTEIATGGSPVKILAMGIDENNRSNTDYIDVPLQKISDTESITAKQPGTIWRIGMRGTSPIARTNKGYAQNGGALSGGAFEQHLGGPPHFIGWMTGNNENTMQDGSVARLTAGDFFYVRPGALHHSNPLSATLPTVFNLYTPGTDTDIGPYKFVS